MLCLTFIDNVFRFYFSFFFAALIRVRIYWQLRIQQVIQSNLEVGFAVRSQLGFRTSLAYSSCAESQLVTESTLLWSECYIQLYRTHIVPNFCLQSNWIIGVVFDQVVYAFTSTSSCGPPPPTLLEKQKHDQSYSELVTIIF